MESNLSLHRVMIFFFNASVKSQKIKAFWGFFVNEHLFLLKQMVEATPCSLPQLLTYPDLNELCI